MNLLSELWIREFLTPPTLVAVTRAKALLIVVGDPDVLGLDPLWRSFLNHVHARGGWTGPPPVSWNIVDEGRLGSDYDVGAQQLGLADMNEFTRRMEAMTLNGASTADHDEEGEANIDRPWRDVE